MRESEQLRSDEKGHRDPFTMGGSVRVVGLW